MQSTHPFDASDISNEFNGISLGDKRLDRRARRFAEDLAQHPAASLPKAIDSEAALEAAYRLMSNKRASADKIIAPHFAATWGRTAGFDCVLSVEDTTEARFGGNKLRDGLGELQNGGHGFYIHTSLLLGLSPEGCFLPLGIGAYELMVRDPERQKLPKKQQYKDPERESLRWQRVAEEVDDRAEGRPVIHVCDREADDYVWLESLLSRGGHFVVRSQYDRRVNTRTGAQETQQYLREIVNSKTPVRATRDVHFQERTTSGGRRRRDPRSSRTTQLEVRAAEVTIVRPDKTTASSKSLTMNLVVVTESKAPEGEKPIEWSLLTTEPIDSPERILFIVDAYRARWMVEELFKALKTGCSYERLQLESLHALHNALAFCLPIAWQMLALRAFARDVPDAPAEDVLEPKKLKILRFVSGKRDNKWGLKRLQKNVTACEVLYAVARLGGHLKRNGVPGWITISRGLDTLEHLVEAAEMFAGLGA